MKGKILILRRIMSWFKLHGYLVGLGKKKINTKSLKEKNLKKIKDFCFLECESIENDKFFNMLRNLWSSKYEVIFIKRNNGFFPLKVLFSYVYD